MLWEPRQKALLQHLADGQFHSGDDLARELGGRRAGVWALMHQLQDLGLPIHSLPGKGYRLTRPLEFLDETRIRDELRQRGVALPGLLEIHAVLDSTNTHVQQHTEWPAGSLCLSEWQTAGRGRVGRAWHSPFAGNLCMSLSWRFAESAGLGGLSLVIGVAVVRALRQCGVEGVGLKWPNDLLWKERKLGGILLELSGEAHGQCRVVIGLGLNFFIPVESAQAIDQDWVDLQEITGGQLPSRNRLVACIVAQWLELLPAYGADTLPAWLEEWRSLHVLENRAVQVQQGERITRGRIHGIGVDGSLLLQCEDGVLRPFVSGEVRLRADHG